MDRYRTETWPAAALEGADPIKVVSVFFGELLEADVAGYTDLVAGLSPAATELVPSVYEATYMDVTGVAIGRICHHVSDIQVSCDLTYYSGLAPGQELTGRAITFTVIGGLIVDVEAQTAIEDVVVTDESALAEYRTWLEINDPLLAADLFTNGEMRLETEPAIEAQRTNVEQYLARATS